MSSYRRGLSLIEVVIVLSLIAVLMALSLPMLSSANTQARSLLCRQNLADMGEIITSFAMDFERLPDLSQDPPEGEALSFAGFIEPRADNPSLLFCPSDETAQSQADGSSYAWDSRFNGLSLTAIDPTPGTPVLADREAFHEGSELTANALVLQRAGSRYQFAVLGEGDDAFTNAFTHTARAPQRNISEASDAADDAGQSVPRTSPGDVTPSLIISTPHAPAVPSTSPANRFVPLGE